MLQYPVSDAGLRIAAHFYNSNIKRHRGNLEAVMNGKVLDERQRKCLVWNIERQSDRIEPLPWQTDTCLGNWHYDRPLFERHGYKTASMVIHSLADIVSKNGNLLLNVPVRGDGTIDSDEQAIVEEIALWTAANGDYSLHYQKRGAVCDSAWRTRFGKTGHKVIGYREHPLSRCHRTGVVMQYRTIFVFYTGWTGIENNQIINELP